MALTKSAVTLSIATPIAEAARKHFLGKPRGFKLSDSVQEHLAQVVTAAGRKLPKALQPKTK